MSNHTNENNFRESQPIYSSYNYLPVYYNIRHFDQFPQEQSQPIQQTLSRSLYEKPAYKKIISEDALKKMNPILYRDLSESDKLANSSCCISYEEFQDEDEVIQLECSHVFLKKPILHWLQNENSICPVCRFQFESMEVKNTIEEDNTEEYHFQENEYENDNEYHPVLSILDILQQLYYDDIYYNTQS